MRYLYCFEIELPARLTSRFLNGIQRHTLRSPCCEAILKSGESVPSGEKVVCSSTEQFEKLAGTYME